MRKSLEISVQADKIERLFYINFICFVNKEQASLDQQNKLQE